MKLNLKTQHGFVALISVIIISVILLSIATTLSLTGFYGRYNILDSTLKEQSSANAEACMDKAILIIANNALQLSTSTLNIDETNRCTIGPISGPTPYVGIKTFYTQSNTSNYFTTFKVSIDSATFSILSTEEIPTY